MSCPKCATGLLVIERVSVAGGLTFEQWRCINCGKRLDQEDEMTRTAESIAKQVATRAAKKAEKAEAQFQAGYATPKESPPITHVRPRLAVVDRPASPLGPDLPGVWDDGEDKPKAVPKGTPTVTIESAIKPVPKFETPEDAFDLKDCSDFTERSPAIREVDRLIHDLERQLAETRGVRQLLVQRQEVKA